jgi:hypothetical protein
MDNPVVVPTDHPTQELPGVLPVFVREQMLQQMANRYKIAVADLTDEEARDAAIATWETEWPDDPAPRTFEAAKEAVDDDLSCWDED